MYLEKKSDQITNYIIIPIMVITAILTGTTFAFIQHALEFLLILILFILVIPYKLSKIEQVLLFFFIFSQIGSFFINNFQIFLLNAKQFGLAILSLIYFKRNSPKSSFINITVIICIFLIFYEYIIGRYPINIAPYLSTMQDSYGSRALGLFLNFHYSSFFLSIFFIGYTQKNKLFFFDYIILWMISVKTNVIGYIFQKLSQLTFLNKVISNTKLVLVILVSGFISLLIFNEIILEKYQSLDYGFVSAYIIIKQIVDPKSILDAIYIFPQDLILFLNEKSLFDFPELGGLENMDHGSELTIIRILVQGGFFLGITYLFVIFKYFKKFSVFIFISLLHYSFILSPLIIYLMSAYQFEDTRTLKK